MNRTIHTLLALALSGFLALSSTAYAQNAEVEPNQTCSSAQNVGAVSLPFTQDGSLDSTAESPDVDFFRFTGTAGEVVKVELEGEPTGKGTLGDPYLGFFDSSCNLIASNDGFFNLNSSLVLTIPADGVFIMAATTCCDGEFLGGGTGTYQMTISPYVSIGSIRGLVVDALFGDRLRGDIEPYASVYLYRCEDSECNNSIVDLNTRLTDSNGRFRFSSDYSGIPLEVGTYQVFAWANQYQQGQTDPITVAEGEDLDVGKVLLQPNPVQFSDVRHCDNSTFEGGVCRYSVKVTNNLSTSFRGTAWSIVWVYGLNSFTGYTQFQVKKTEPLKLKSHEGTKAEFEFRVPAGALVDGALICTDIYVGQLPHAFFNTVGNYSLFCIYQEASELKVMPQKKAQEMFKQLSGKTAQGAAKAKLGMMSR